MLKRPFTIRLRNYYRCWPRDLFRRFIYVFHRILCVWFDVFILISNRISAGVFDMTPQLIILLKDLSGSQYRTSSPDSRENRSLERANAPAATTAGYFIMNYPGADRPSRSNYKEVYAIWQLENPRLSSAGSIRSKLSNSIKMKGARISQVGIRTLKSTQGHMALLVGRFGSVPCQSAKVVSSGITA